MTVSLTARKPHGNAHLVSFDAKETKEYVGVRRGPNSEYMWRFDRPDRDEAKR